MAPKRLPVPPQPWTFLLPALCRLCSVPGLPLLPCHLLLQSDLPWRTFVFVCYLAPSILTVITLISPGEFSTWWRNGKEWPTPASVKGTRTFSTAISAWPAADRVTLLSCHTSCPGPLILREWPKDLLSSIKARGAHSFWVISAGSHILHLHSSFDSDYFPNLVMSASWHFWESLISFPHFPLFCLR